MLKNISLCLLMALFSINLFAQEKALTVKYPNPDASPLDALYYPLNAVKVKKEDAAVPLIRVLYSRPQKKGREVFGVLEQFDKVWRLGANENTEIRFAKAVTIGNKRIKAGTYALFAIPRKEKWTIIVNKQTDRWGAFSYDESKDLVRVDVPVTKLEKVVDSFSMTFVDFPEGANLMMAWDRTQVALPVYFKK